MVYYVGDSLWYYMLSSKYMLDYFNSCLVYYLFVYPYYNFTLVNVSVITSISYLQV